MSAFDSQMADFTRDATSVIKTSMLHVFDDENLEVCHFE